jgi:hypothetical protein
MPSDRHLFGPMKIALAGRRGNAEKAANILKSVIRSSVLRWMKCIKMRRDCRKISMIPFNQHRYNSFQIFANRVLIFPVVKNNTKTSNNCSL